MMNEVLVCINMLQSVIRYSVFDFKARCIMYMECCDGILKNTVKGFERSTTVAMFVLNVVLI
jgi:hypothetical protein